MVCGAPTLRSAKGRSAVNAINGTRALVASAIAGCSSAAAVPEVVTIRTGLPVVLAIPRAKNDDDRSSWCDQSVMLESANARDRGVLREPGLTQACSTPSLLRTSTRVTAKGKLRSGI